MSNVGNLTNPDKTQGTVTAAIQTLKSNAYAEITSENAAFSLGQGRISKLLPAGLSSVVSTHPRPCDPRRNLGSQKATSAYDRDRTPNTELEFDSCAYVIAVLAIIGCRKGRGLQNPPTPGREVSVGELSGPPELGTVHHQVEFFIYVLKQLNKVTFHLNNAAIIVASDFQRTIQFWKHVL